MSKKHFQAVADAIRERLLYAEQDRDRALKQMKQLSEQGDERSADFAERIAELAGARVNEITDMADALCEVFYAENPRFDRGRFLSACGIN